MSDLVDREALAAIAAELARAVREAPRRLALSPDEAAAALGLSRDAFDKYVLPSLRVTRVGRRIVVSTAELERWLERNAALPLDEEVLR